MATYSKLLLSGSTSGRMIKVAATSTPGTTIHTAVSGTTSFDEVWLWAANSDTVIRKLTIEWGGTTAPDDTIEIQLPPESGLIPLTPGLTLNGGVLVRAFASVANAILVVGYVNRIAP